MGARLADEGHAVGWPTPSATAAPDDENTELDIDYTGWNRPATTAAPWMQRFKPDFDVFAGNPMVACECGWSWDATDGADTLADAVTACERHVEEDHADA